MIDERDRIYRSLETFQWDSACEPWEGKVTALDMAVTSSLQDIAPRAMASGRIHMSLSGGVDSTLILFRLLALGFPVTAHTLAINEDHPDLVYARQAVASTSGDVRHEAHILKPGPEDIEESNRITGQDSSRPDNYFLLMRAVAEHTENLVSGDVIDELLGGYHTHRGPNREAFQRHLTGLISRHLNPLDQCSTAMGVRAFLPYASEGFMACCSTFGFTELADEIRRKKPVYEMCRRAGIPDRILWRRKIGLVSAMVTSSCPAGQS